MNTKQKSNYDKTHCISSLDKIPKDAHYVVLIQSSASYPDPYENTNPRGDQYITHQYLEYVWFEDQEALDAWIMEDAKTMYLKKKYRVLKVTPVEVELHTTLKIKE